MNRRAWPLLGASIVHLAVALGADAQDVTITPPVVSFSACFGGPNPPARAVAVGSTAGSLTWQSPGGTAPWLRAAPLSGTTPATLTVSVDVSGLPVGSYRDSVVINAGGASPVRLQVLLAVVQCAPPGANAEFEVELLFVGYTGLTDGYPNCRVNPSGTDFLFGTVKERAPPQADEDTEYTGVLYRMTNIDYCETRGRRYPGDDEQVHCAASLAGTASMVVEITVYGEADRGAWVKARPTVGSSPSVRGDCEAALQAQIVASWPGGETGGSPDGQPIEDVRSSTKFFDGTLARLRVGNFTADPSRRESVWSLRVVRRIR